MLEKFSWRTNSHPAYDVSTLLKRGFDYDLQSSLEKIHDGRAEQLTAGADHEVYVFNDELVIKRLKPSSREALVYQFGVDPNDVLPMQKAEKPLPTGKVNGSQIIEFMRRSHTDITQALGVKNFAPTIFVLDQNEVFRLQPYYQFGTVSGDRVAEAIMSRFYEDIHVLWNTFKSSDKYSLWPYIMRKFYDHFGIDDGIRPNALFKGVLDNPPCIIIDY